MLTARASAPLLAGTRRLVHCVCAARPGAGSRPQGHSWHLAPGPTRLAQHGHDRAVHASCSASGAAAAVAEEGAGLEAGGPQHSKAGSLVLYNTLTRRKEVFTPRGDQGNKVSLYVCGVTVYDYSHIGHARVYVAFDTLFRQLRHRGYDVTYVRNFTDVDDKIIRRANEVSVSCTELTERYIAEFHSDMALLRCLPPSLEPRATGHIDDIVVLIQRIIANGHAYALPNGDVYFEVATLPGYGRLSGRQDEDNRAGERVAVDARKRSAADFALWKSAKPGEPSWESPWGPGRPGWHIECSAMIEALLGPVIDIHGGGVDLVFPHHENELAQSAAACGCGAHHRPVGEPLPSFARFWMHNGFVNVDSEKMSKSLGNFFTIRDVVARYAPSALRLMLLGTHYRAAINYTQRALEEASDRMFYIFQTLADADAAVAADPSADAAPPTDAAPAAAKGKKAPPPGPAELAMAMAADLPTAVATALDDDLNTPQALAALSAPLKAANDLLSTKQGRKAPNRIAALRQLVHSMRRALDMLGLSDGGQPFTQLAPLRQAALQRAGLTAADVEAAMARRIAARQAGDYAAGDTIRVELAVNGIALQDGPDGTMTWRPAAAAVADTP